MGSRGKAVGYERERDFFSGCVHACMHVREERGREGKGGEWEGEREGGEERKRERRERASELACAHVSV